MFRPTPGTPQRHSKGHGNQGNQVVVRRRARQGRGDEASHPNWIRPAGPILNLHDPPCCLPLPPAVSRCLPWSPVAPRCLPWSPVVPRGLPLPPVVFRRPPNCELLTYDLRPTTCYLLPTTYDLLPPTYYRVRTTYYRLPTPYSLRPTTYYLRPTTYYLRPKSVA